MVGTGAFAKGQSKEAMISEMDKSVKTMMMSIRSSSVVKDGGKPSPQMLEKLEKLKALVSYQKEHLLKTGTTNDSVASEMQRLKESMISKEKSEKTTGNTTLTNTGAFAKDQSKEATSEGIIGFVKSIWEKGTQVLSDTYKSTGEGTALGIGEGLKSSVEEKSKSSSSTDVTNALNTGAFDRENIHDAKRESVAEYIARVTGSSHSAGSSQNSVNELSKLHDSSSDDQSRSSIETSLARTMDWLESAGNVTGNEHATGDAHVTGMDYTEDTKGIVNTLMTNRAQLERGLEARKYGDLGQGSSIIPGMDEVGAYLLGEQSENMKKMVALLASIDSKVGGGVGPRSGPEVIESNGKKQKHLQHGGLDINDMSKMDPSWGLSFFDDQFGTVTTEGTGIYG